MLFLPKVERLFFQNGDNLQNFAAPCQSRAKNKIKGVKRKSLLLKVGLCAILRANKRKRDKVI